MADITWLSTLDTYLILYLYVLFHDFSDPLRQVLFSLFYEEL